MGRQVVDFCQASVKNARGACSSKSQNLSRERRFRAGIELEAVTWRASCFCLKCPFSPSNLEVDDVLYMWACVKTKYMLN